MTTIRLIFSFFAWWKTELSAVLPTGLRRAVGLERRSLVVRLEGRTVEAYLGDARSGLAVAATEVTPEDWGDLGANFARALHGLDAKAVDTTLQIGATQVVRRHLRLPPTPDRDLQGLLSFEIERHTPFKPEEAYLTYARRDGDGDATSVSISVAPRRVVDPLIDSLTRIGFAPSRVVLGDDNHRPVDGLGVRRRHGQLAIAGGVLAILLVAAAVSPLLRLERVADDLASAVDAAKRGAEARDDSTVRGLAVVRFLDTYAREHPSPLAVLDELAALLPDGTWLVQFNQSGRTVALEGQAESSADLVPRLEGSPRFSSVGYDAPVTKEGAGRGERFAFSLEIVGDIR